MPIIYENPDPLHVQVPPDDIGIELEEEKLIPLRKENENNGGKNNGNKTQ